MTGAADYAESSTATSQHANERNTFRPTSAPSEPARPDEAHFRAGQLATFDGRPAIHADTIRALDQASIHRAMSLFCPVLPFK
jgi:hypothetical protein